MRKIDGLDRILLVDDDEITNLIHKRTIQNAGIDAEIISVPDGAKALEHLKEEADRGNPPPDLIFLDINMPTMDGWSFLEKYGEFPDNLKAKAIIVMLTTSTDTGDLTAAVENPDVKKYVNKTLTKEKLEEILELYFT